jgi:phosphoserine phosphatase
MRGSVRFISGPGSMMVQRVYERLGFRTIFSTRLFELDA